MASHAHTSTAALDSSLDVDRQSIDEQRAVDNVVASFAMEGMILGPEHQAVLADFAAGRVDSVATVERIISLG